MIRLNAQWNWDAHVWVVTSPDVRGLVTTTPDTADIRPRATNIILGLTGKEIDELEIHFYQSNPPPEDNWVEAECDAPDRA